MARPKRAAKKSEGAGYDQNDDEKSQDDHDDDFSGAEEEINKRKKNRGEGNAPGRGTKRTKTATASKGKDPAELTSLSLGNKQICSFLDPPTLLAMTRTCRVFRNMLTGDHSSSIWSQSFASIGLPEPTADDVTYREITRSPFHSTHHLRPAVSVPDPALRETERLGTKPQKGLTPFLNSNRSAFYWAPTVRHISSILSSLRGDDLANEVKRRKKNAKCARLDGLALQKWQDSNAADRAAAGEDAKEARIKAIDANWRWRNYTHPHVISFLDQERNLVRQEEILQRQSQRRQDLRPLYDHMSGIHSSRPGIDPTIIFPSFHVFINLSTVTPIWTPDPKIPDGTTELPLHDFAVRILYPIHGAQINSEIDRLMLNKRREAYRLIIESKAADGDGASSAADESNVKHEAFFSQAIHSLACRFCPDYLGTLCDITKHFESVHRQYNETMDRPFVVSSLQIKCIRAVLNELDLKEDEATLEEISHLRVKFKCGDEPCVREPVQHIHPQSIFAVCRFRPSARYSEAMTLGQIVGVLFSFSQNSKFHSTDPCCGLVISQVSHLQYCHAPKTDVEGFTVDVLPPIIVCKEQSSEAVDPSTSLEGSASSTLPQV
ncbi:hypothetical protein T439DRAFT_361743 [Meredithblackwellia eburnea MCA 4105]